MPNEEKEIDAYMQEAIEKFDTDCKLTDKEWSDLDKDVQDDLALLDELGEALCRVSSPSESEKADTDLAWERMKTRMHHEHSSETNGEEGQKKEKAKSHRLHTVFYAALAAAAALLLLFLVTRPEEPQQSPHSVIALSQKPNVSAVRQDKKENKTSTAAPSATGNNTAATVTCTAIARKSMSNATQLIMELQNQGYAVDGRVQRSSQTVKPGKLGKIVLPDGTEAYLYAKSKLTYPSAFVGNTRDVVLEGEAYFKVTHDASHPFIIHTASATTRVLGTELNVRAYHGEPLHVALITGVAEVVGGNDVCRLKPGEGVTLQSGILLKQLEDMDVYAYALRGLLYADDEPLEKVMMTLAHWYGMGVNFVDRKSAARRIHFFMRGSDTPNKAVELLNSMGIANVSIQGDNFIID